MGADPLVPAEPVIRVDRSEDLRRVHHALLRAAEALRPFEPGATDWTTKSDRGDPLTEADLAVDAVLRDVLPAPGDGWLSEETVDDRSRLDADRVWIVDPLDGTREFIEGIPEWCISIGLVEGGEPVVGGVLNPAADGLVLGAVGHGVTWNGTSVDPRPGRASLRDARVLASRSEVGRGEWDRYRDEGFEVVPCGSVAWKLALVAAQRADATWTLVPKHEWDVAGGAALVRAAGLEIGHVDGTPRRFNLPDPKLPNFLAGPAGLLEELRGRLAGRE